MISDINMRDYFDDSNSKSWNPKLWKNASTYWNDRLIIPATKEEKLISWAQGITNEDNLISYELFVARSIFPPGEITMEVGIGKCNEHGTADRDEPHWICMDDMIIRSHKEHHGKQIISDYQQKPVNNLQVEICLRNNSILFSSNDTILLDLHHINVEQMLEKNLQIIAAVNTSYGTIDLVPRNFIPRLERLTTHNIIKSLDSLDKVDQLCVPSYSHLQMRKHWIQYHATIIIPHISPKN